MPPQQPSFGTAWPPPLLLLAAALGSTAAARAEGGEVEAVVIADRLPRLADPLAADLEPADLLLAKMSRKGWYGSMRRATSRPGLAERWAVSDDGLSYVFRLRTATWSDGRRVRARDVVRLIERQLARRSRDPLLDTMGAVRDGGGDDRPGHRGRTDAPRPHLLQLLAQPQFALVRGASGTGPFTAAAEGDGLVLTRTLPGFDGDEAQQERVRLTAAAAPAAIQMFIDGEAELVLGGTVSDFPLASAAKLPRTRLRVDPVVGLFGLVPARNEGLAADLERARPARRGDRPRCADRGAAACRGCNRG